MANTYDTNLILQSIASAITNAATSDPNLLAKLQAIADAITNGGGGGSVTASNVSVVPTSPFVSTNLQNLSVEEANAIATNTGDITTINTALGNTSISGIGDGSVTGALSSIDGDVNTIETALGNTSISGIGDGSVTGAISTLNNSLGIQTADLWTNSSPSTEFASQTVTITDATDYKFFVLLIKRSTSSSLYHTMLLTKGNNITFNTTIDISTSLVIYNFTRTFNLSNSSLIVTDCSQKAANVATTSTTNNGMMIPYKLIGFK